MDTKGKRKKKYSNGIWTFGSPGDPNAIDTFNKNVNISTTDGDMCGTCESFSDYDALNMLREADDEPHEDDFDAQQRRDAQQKLRHTEDEEQKFVNRWFATHPDGNWGDCYPEMLKALNKQTYWKFIKKDKFDRCTDAQNAFNRLVRNTDNSSGIKDTIAPNFDVQVNKVWFEGKKYGPNAIKKPSVRNTIDALGKGLNAYVNYARNKGRR